MPAILEHRNEPRLVRRFHVSFLRRDGTLINQVNQHVAELNHSELA